MASEQSDFLESLPRVLRDAAQSFEFDKGAAIFRQGDPVWAMFVVLRGQVRLCRFGRDGEEIVLRCARRGDLFGEVALDSACYQGNAIVFEPTHLQAYPVQLFRDLLDHDAVFARQWRMLLSWQLRKARARIERLALKRAAERVRHYLLTEGSGPAGELELAGSLKEFARELGLAHETLYRTLREMESRSEIERVGKLLRLGRKTQCL